MQRRCLLKLDEDGTLQKYLLDIRRTIPPGRLGANAGPEMVVIYLADRDTIISGYQASDLSEVRIPTDALWLRR